MPHKKCSRRRCEHHSHGTCGHHRPVERVYVMDPQFNMPFLPQQYVPMVSTPTWPNPPLLNNWPPVVCLPSTSSSLGNSQKANCSRNEDIAQRIPQIIANNKSTSVSRNIRSSRDVNVSRDSRTNFDLLPKSQSRIHRRNRRHRSHFKVSSADKALFNCLKDLLINPVSRNSSISSFSTDSESSSNRASSNIFPYEKKAQEAYFTWNKTKRKPKKDLSSGNSSQSPDEHQHHRERREFKPLYGFQKKKEKREQKPVELPTNSRRCYRTCSPANRRNVLFACAPSKSHKSKKISDHYEEEPVREKSIDTVRSSRKSTRGEPIQLFMNRKESKKSVIKDTCAGADNCLEANKRLEELYDMIRQLKNCLCPSDESTERPIRIGASQQSLVQENNVESPKPNVEPNNKSRSTASILLPINSPRTTEHSLESEDNTRPSPPTLEPETNIKSSRTTLESENNARSFRPSSEPEENLRPTQSSMEPEINLRSSPQTLEPEINLRSSPQTLEPEIDMRSSQLSLQPEIYVRSSRLSSKPDGDSRSPETIWEREIDSRSNQHNLEPETFSMSRPTWEPHLNPNSSQRSWETERKSTKPQSYWEPKVSGRSFQPNLEPYMEEEEESHTCRCSMFAKQRSVVLLDRDLSNSSLDSEYSRTEEEQESSNEELEDSRMSSRKQSQYRPIIIPTDRKSTLRQSEQQYRDRESTQQSIPRLSEQQYRDSQSGEQYRDRQSTQRSIPSQSEQYRDRESTQQSRRRQSTQQLGFNIEQSSSEAELIECPWNECKCGMASDDD